MRTLNPQTESLQKFIDRAPLSRRQRLIFLLTFLFVVVDGMDLSIVSHIFPKLISEWGASIEQVTLTVVAGIFAMAIGALVSGPAAGRWGRKPVLVFSFVLINVATAALALTGTIEVFIAVRVLACLGIGAVMPLALTMVADWAPAARRAQMVALVFSGVGVGSIIGAYLAAALIPSFGWQTLVVVAGLVPLIVVPFYLRFVPEPPAALIKRGRPSADVRQSLAAIDADSANVDTTADETSQAARVNVFAVVFARVLAVSTTLIWVLTFM